MDQVKDIFNDIIDDKTIEDISTSINEDETVTTESIQLKSLPNEFIEKITSLEEIDRLKRQISSMNKIDKSLAMEAFAAMKLNTNINEAKLTTTPSFLNKDVVERLFNEKYYKISTDDFLDYFDEYEVINQLKDQTLFCLKELKIFLSIIEELEGSITPPVKVIYLNKEYDLITSNFEDLVIIDDNYIMYKPYENKLSSILNSLYIKINEFNNIFTIYRIDSLYVAVKSITNIINFIEKDLLPDLDRVLYLIKSIIDDCKIATKLELVNKYEYIEKISKDKLVYLYLELNKNDNVFENLINYLKLIKNN